MARSRSAFWTRCTGPPARRPAAWPGSVRAVMAREARSLHGQVAAVTGGARGIRRATAPAPAPSGLKVAIGDLDGGLAAEAAASIGRDAVGLELDVTDEASFSGFLDQVEAQLGPLDVLVNNAGIMAIGPFLEESEATAARQVDLNLPGVLRRSHAHGV